MSSRQELRVDKVRYVDTSDESDAEDDSSDESDESVETAALESSDETEVQAESDEDSEEDSDSEEQEDSDSDSDSDDSDYEMSSAEEEDHKEQVDQEKKYRFLRAHTRLRIEAPRFGIASSNQTRFNTVIHIDLHGAVSDHILQPSDMIRTRCYDENQHGILNLKYIFKVVSVDESLKLSDFVIKVLNKSNISFYHSIPADLDHRYNIPINVVTSCVEFHNEHLAIRYNTNLMLQVFCLHFTSRRIFSSFTMMDMMLLYADVNRIFLFLDYYHETIQPARHFKSRPSNGFTTNFRQKMKQPQTFDVEAARVEDVHRQMYLQSLPSSWRTHVPLLNRVYEPAKKDFHHINIHLFFGDYVDLHVDLLKINFEQFGRYVELKWMFNALLHGLHGMTLQKIQESLPIGFLNIVDTVCQLRPSFATFASRDTFNIDSYQKDVTSLPKKIQQRSRRVLSNMDEKHFNFELCLKTCQFEKCLTITSSPAFQYTMPLFELLMHIPIIDDRIFQLHQLFLHNLFQQRAQFDHPRLADYILKYIVYLFDKIFSQLDFGLTPRPVPLPQMASVIKNATEALEKHRQSKTEADKAEANRLVILAHNSTFAHVEAALDRTRSEVEDIITFFVRVGLPRWKDWMAHVRAISFLQVLQPSYLILSDSFEFRYVKFSCMNILAFLKETIVAIDSHEKGTAAQ